MEENLKCIICIGVPASGKSTWAIQQLAKRENYVRLNRDSYRYMLKNQGFCEPKIESMITVLFFHAIDLALAAKQNIIIDNTNVKESVINEIVSYVEHRADVEYMLFPISLETAIERDAAREHPVGELIISGMYKQYTVLMDSFKFQNQKKKKYIYKEPVKIKDLETIVIFDLDGTLTHVNGKRGFYDWDKTDRDDLDLTMYNLYLLHKNAGHKIFIVTARTEEARESTTLWLDTYDIKYDKLLMRKSDEDRRRAAVVKREIYMEEIHEKYNVEVVYDDDPRVVEMWRKLGLKTLQVEKGYI